MKHLPRTVFAVISLLLSHSGYSQTRILFPGEFTNVGGVQVECRSSGDGGDVCDRSGVITAKDICNHLYYSGDQQNCLNALANARYIDGSAATACGAEHYPSDTIVCMGAIPNKEFDPGEVENCKSKYYASDRLTCFQHAGFPARCSGGGPNAPTCDRSGVVNAKAICNQLFSTNDQMECLAGLNRARYVNNLAATNCGSEYYAVDTTNCMAAIADKEYDPGEVEACKAKYNPAQRIACLQGGGYPAPCMP
jgi:hypothetical protein